MMDRLTYRLLDEAYLKQTFGCDEDGVITVPTASHGNCGSRCVIKIRIKDGKILGLSTDSCEESPEQPQIRACLKGHSYLDTFLSQERILYPMKRVGKRGEGKFRPISWEEAVSEIAGEMTRIRDTYGPQARYCNYATGYEMCAASPSVMIRRLLAMDGGYLGYYNNYSCSPSVFAASLMYGTTNTGNSRSDYVNSKLILLWGYNPAETYCGGNTSYSLLKAKQAGAKIIVIDSRFSDTAAAFADQWIAPLPTTDSALSDAMAYVIYTEGLHCQDFLDKYCIGFDEKTMPGDISAGESYLDYLLGHKDGTLKTPAWAAAITGLSEEVIRTLAIEYATAKPAAILEGYGPGRHAYGEQFSRGLITLACMTGNVGISGGSAAGLGQLPHGVNQLMAFPGVPFNPYPGKIPCFSWTDAAERAAGITPDKGLRGVERLDTDIKMIFNLAGNCLINQHGDINHTARLLSDPQKVECIVCSDIFLTPSARYADILLPGTTMLETENITASSARFDDFFKINPVMEPPGECRFDYDWISDVAGEMGLREAFTEGKSLHDWLEDCVLDLKRRLPDFPDMKIFTTTGVYKRNYYANYIAFEEKIRDIERYPFRTPSGKIEIFVRSLYEQHDPDINPLPGYMTAWEGPEDALKNTYPLQCIGYHTKVRTHSVHYNNEKLRALEPQALWIHPSDAKVRGIRDQESVYVYNSRGITRIMAKITERIRPGVVAMPQGAWFAPDENGVDQNGCINTLTSLRPTPIARANAQHTNLVEVRKEMPEIMDCDRGDVGTVSNCDDGAKMPKNKMAAEFSMFSCTGCLTCVAACPYGNMRVFEEKTTEKNRPVYYRPVSCGRCKAPACKAACPIRIL